jgi:pyroglutamyl-peptidase
VPSRLLVSGFEPFEGVPWNPSGPIAQRLGEGPPAGVETWAVVLPTIYTEAATLLAGLIGSFGPTHVLVLGIGSHPTQVRVERFAVNLADSSPRGDNLGRTPNEEPLVAGGPAGYFSTLPVMDLVSHLRAAGLDARASTGAGTFVCNDVFYRTMHLCATLPSPPFAGFVHLPFVQGMLEATSVSPTLDALVEGLRAGLERILA